VVGESWFGLSVHHVLARSVRDSAALLDIEQGPEVGDPYFAPPRARPFSEEVGADPGLLRVAVSPDPLLGKHMEPECRFAVHEAARLLDSLGHRVEYVEVPINSAPVVEAFLTTAAAEAALLVTQTAELAGRKSPVAKDYEAATWVLGLVGEKLSAEKLAAAFFEIRSAGRAMGRFFQRFDVLVTSTLGRVPWRHRELQPNALEERLLKALRRAPVKPALMAVFRQLADKVIDPIPNTPLFNLTGQPAMSIPLSWSSGGLPIGVQMAGRFGDEATLFRLAAQLEAAQPWAERYPFNRSVLAPKQREGAPQGDPRKNNRRSGQRR
jgi:amidase